ncbi:MAG: hypothetical protein O7B81_15545 [Gammaproteobacteria bacterium]|nr:hypothetical protein [Gammaproteobacteria bacterium]
MEKMVPAMLFACSIAAHSATADLFFADFFAFESITDFDFGYRGSLPVVEIAYVRSAVGERFTGITVTLDDPDFKIVGHSCPFTLANGSSCMILFSFDPQRPHSTNEPNAGVSRAHLVVTGNEGFASLRISGHQNRRYCEERRLPLGPGCATPER